MKKFLLLLSLIFLLGCSMYKKVPVYQKAYTLEQREEAILDAYWWIDAFNGDSISIEDWFSFQSYVQDGYMVEKVYQKTWDEKTEIVITLTTCICDSTTYHLSVLKRTKDKTQW